MLISKIIMNEAERNEQMIREYETLLSELPKGSLICRKNEYYYLKYRENGRVCDKYIGKDGKAVSEVKGKLELRRHYTEMLSALKREREAINKALEELS